MALETENKRNYYLNELDNLKVHHNDSDVRGWNIYTSDKQKIGEVENLLVDKEAKRVRYLDVHLEDDMLGEHSAPFDAKNQNNGLAEKMHEHVADDGARHVLIPVGVVNINENDEYVNLKDYSRNDLSYVPRYNRKKGYTGNYEVQVREKFLPAEYNQQNDKWRNSKSNDLGADFYVDEYYASKNS